MKITIVTAVFNRKATIGQTVRSVGSQSHENVEHIIQDGGSTDGTLEVLANLQSKHGLLVQSAPDNGIYDAINKGINRASGDVVGLMHSDDFYASDDVLSKVAERLKDSRIQGVYGDLDYVSVGDTAKIHRRWRSGSYNRKNLTRGWMPPHPTLYLRRSVFEEWGVYDTSYQIAADYDAMLRWLWAGQFKLAYIPEIMVKMRVGGESNRSLGRILRKSHEDYRALKSNGVGGFGALVLKNISKIRQFLP